MWFFFVLHILIQKEVTSFEQYVLRILPFLPFIFRQKCRLRIAANAILFSSLGNKQLGFLAWKRG